MAKRPNNLVLVTPFVMLFVGVICMSWSTVVHLFDHIQAASTVVQHPTKYDYSAYNRLLKAHVKIVGIKNLVDYQGLKNDPDLNKAIEQLRITSPDKLSEADQTYFWLNAYNLVCLKIIADRYPVESGKQTSSDMHKRLFVIGGKTTNVRDILTQKLYPRLITTGKPDTDESLVYLICGGTIGEPNLMPYAITEATAPVDMQIALDTFFKSPLRAYIISSGGEFYISPWFYWHRAVFNVLHRDLHDYVLTLMSPTDRRENSLYSLRKVHPKFDWRINDVKFEKFLAPRFGQNGVPYPQTPEESRY